MESLFGIVALVFLWFIDSVIVLATMAKESLSYIFSRTFRDKVNARFAPERAWKKWVWLVSGLLPLVPLVIVFVGVIYFFVRPEPEPSLTEKLIESAIESVLE
ncbi:hypothetical protein [Salinibius halmophilus]|uniref:hypothetical protein n=1 Tax=Salinibius halmophilus TaxID=1853216 RepID=UPI000E66A524|nr:hypothetical protein [Salinibius halmophilus]